MGTAHARGKLVAAGKGKGAHGHSRSGTSKAVHGHVNHQTKIVHHGHQGGSGAHHSGHH